MKAVNIYALTRAADRKWIRPFDKQMSGRDYYMPVKDWEIDGLKKLADALAKEGAGIDRLQFFYSFQIPKLGKEFDLLQISGNTVLNIELKSQSVPDDKIKRQLLLNKHYLNSLGKDVYLFTFISSQDRLVRLTGSDRLVDAEWGDVCKLLYPGRECLTDNIEALFGEEKYLVSPLNDPNRFLRRDYFLTSQQRDIRSKIIRQLQEKNGFTVQAFFGLPGTGKTLLLYDLALYLSERQNGAILHFGPFSEGMSRLNTLLKRIDFISCDTRWEEMALKDYAFIGIDAGHRMPGQFWEKLAAYAKQRGIPVIISYDDESAIHPEERENDVESFLLRENSVVKYSLTNRIRTNPQLSSFIREIVHRTKNYKRRDLSRVQVFYAQDAAEAELLLKNAVGNGYVCLDSVSTAEETAAKLVLEGDYERVVMTLDDTFYYDEKGYLRQQGEEMYGVSKLFHGLNRGKQEIAIVVSQNPEVFANLLAVLQGED